MQQSTIQTGNLSALCQDPYVHNMEGMECTFFYTPEGFEIARSLGSHFGRARVVFSSTALNQFVSTWLQLLLRMLDSKPEAFTV